MAIYQSMQRVRFRTSSDYEQFKLIFEDLRKINELDWRERFVDGDWSEVMKQLVQRSDQIETEVRSLRSFIKKEERPAVGAPTKAVKVARSGQPADEVPEMRPPKPGRKAPKKGGRSAPAAGRARRTR